MQVSEYKYGEYHGDGKRRAVCLGFFDGVHIGHRALIRECVGYAKKNGLIPTVFTFPSECDRLKGGAVRIYSTEDKLEIFASLGIEHTVLADFDSVAGLSPADFVHKALIRDLGAVSAHSGTSFRFGIGASGGSEMLVSLMKERGLSAFTVGDVLLDGAPVSSTRIRNALSSGDTVQASLLLGEPYFTKGTVVHGDGRGHLYGIPTVNTALPYAALLRSGVYRTEIEISGRRYSALTNVGTCPTFGERERHAETLILDFSGDLYGERVKIRYLEFQRGERKFESAEELISTIKKDIKRIK